MLKNKLKAGPLGENHSYDEIMSSDQVKIKRYFYILRPILACMWIEKNQTMPPMEFGKLMTNQVLDPYLVNEINKLLQKKVSGLELDLEPKSPVIIDFFKAKIEYYEEYLKSGRKGSATDYTALNELFINTHVEVWG